MVVIASTQECGYTPIVIHHAAEAVYRTVETVNLWFDLISIPRITMSYQW